MKRDSYTAGHQQRVAELCVAIGRKLGLAEDRIQGLRPDTTIRDIGKIAIPAEILGRPGKLSVFEFELMKTHPQVGYDILRDVKFPRLLRYSGGLITSIRFTSISLPQKCSRTALPVPPGSARTWGCWASCPHWQD